MQNILLMHFVWNRCEVTLRVCAVMIFAGMFFVLSTQFQFNNHAIHQNKK